jgi:nucleotide-binding universal stress UspA family protein
VTVLLAHLADDRGEAVLAAALEQARFRGEPLVVVNVASGEKPLDDRIVPDDELDHLVGRAARAGVTATVEQPLEGDVAAAVLDAAERHQVSLVVVGVRRRSAVGKLLMGSKAQRIILDADVPVLAVK